MTSAHADENSWKGISSFYTPVLQKVESTWPIQGLSELSQQKEPLKIQALSTEGDAYFIGVVQMMTIKAPLATVAGFLDHFEEYPKYFDGLKKAQILETKIENEESLFRIYFEQSVPVPFIPNDKSEMIYSVKTIGTSKRFDRYQFRTGNDLISNDGIIILDALSTRLTRYVEFDFWNANWGIAKTFGAKKIWDNSLSGLVQSDLAIKLKSENPTWTEKQVVSESKKMADDYPVEDRFKNRVDSKKWLKAHGIDLNQ
jgi:hypothetical protein